MARRGKKITSQEKKHLTQVAEIGCIACINQGDGPTPAEVHHIRAGMGAGQRNDTFRTIPLCHTHHRTGGYGVAIHAGQKEWERVHGDEETLLRQVERILEMDFL